MFRDSHRMVFTFLSWLDLLGVALAFRISIFKNLQIISKLLTQGYSYHKLRKTFGKFLCSYFDLLSIYVSEGISHPVLYGDLVYKKGGSNVKRISSRRALNSLRGRKYDPVLIERTIALEISPSTALYRSVLQHCTLTIKAVGTIWRDLSKTSSEETRPRCSSPLIVCRDSFNPWTWARGETGGA